MSRSDLLKSLRFSNSAPYYFKNTILNNKFKKSSLDNRALIIPCAGRSSRFRSFETPKPLAKIDGVPCLIRLIDDLCPYFKKVYVAVPNDPKIRDLYKTNIDRYFSKSSIEMIEVEPGKGDGDAIYEVLKEIKNITYSSIMIAWGDAVINNKDLIHDCILGFNKLKTLTPLFFPTYETVNPYVSVARDNNGQVVKINFTRKGDYVDYGESDLCIFFCSQNIFQYLDSYRSKILDKKNGNYLTYNNEFNFLETVHDITSQNVEVVACCIGNEDDVLSFNSLEELNKVQLKIS